MKLKTFITTDRILLGVNQGSRREVLKELIQPLVKDYISDEEAFLDDLEAREDQVTTVMENGVAFPHARSENVKRLGVVVATAPDGIQFGPEETGQSKLFIMIAVPSFAPTAHIPILQILANYVKDQKRVDRLVASTTPSQIVRSLANLKG